MTFNQLVKEIQAIDIETLEAIVEASHEDWVTCDDDDLSVRAQYKAEHELCKALYAYQAARMVNGFYGQLRPRKKKV